MDGVQDSDLLFRTGGFGGSRNQRLDGHSDREQLRFSLENYHQDSSVGVLSFSAFLSSSCSCSCHRGLRG